MKEKLYYYLVNKPYNMLSQFSDKENRPVLKSLYPFPSTVYPVGRLDMDSEGLLLITNDKPLTNLLLNPKFLHEREYIVLVEGLPSDEALDRLCKGVIIEGKVTLPAVAKRIERPEFLWERVPQLPLKPSLTYSYISLTIREGRNRQVRKMTANVGHPTMRLIRYRIANITLGTLMAGGVRELRAEEIAGLKKLLR